MNYNENDLLLLVTDLAKQYTSKESSSISYSTAQQLMGAVIYCLDEAMKVYNNSLISDRLPNTKDLYSQGYDLIKAKCQRMLCLYNKQLKSFKDYGVECLYETYSKGISAFFAKYDAKFNPQTTIITLDYPVLYDLGRLSGINRITEYMLCINKEQRFLSALPFEYVTDTLRKYSDDYSLIMDNLCEIILTSLTGYFLAQKPIAVAATDELPNNSCFTGLNKNDIKKISLIISKLTKEEFQILVLSALKKIIEIYYQNDKALYNYLSEAVKSISIRIYTAWENNNLNNIF